MQFLLPLASLLGLEVEELLARIRKNAIAWSAVAIFAVIALAFVLVAINNAATLAWGPVVGPLAVALVALVIALIVWGVMQAGEGAARRRSTERRQSKDRTALVTTAALTAIPIALQSSLVRKVGIPLGGALAAAYFLSRSSRRGNKD